MRNGADGGTEEPNRVDGGRLVTKDEPNGESGWGRTDEPNQESRWDKNKGKEEQNGEDGGRTGELKQLEEKQQEAKGKEEKAEDLATKMKFGREASGISHQITALSPLFRWVFSIRYLDWQYFLCTLVITSCDASIVQKSQGSFNFRMQCRV